jgi:alginate O-acetyltransferase complex protein AlgI
MQTAVAKPARHTAWLPLGLLPISVIALRPALPPWVFMWTLALALYLGFKWFTWRRARAAGVAASASRAAAYLLLWPGMDAHTFLDPSLRPARPARTNWLTAAAQLLLGALLLWAVARQPVVGSGLLRGWIGMLGLILLLHFGLFQLLALFWQARGVWAPPIMRSPLLAASLAELWGERWNLAFRQLSHVILFGPLRGRVGAGRAALVAFLASGLIHELVISLPAGDGFGLPIGYFLLQWIGILLQRSWRRGRSDVTDRRLGRVFTMAWAGAPAFWLFHPPFVTRVFLPFMVAIGAL